jgi:hypothetical protein
MNNDELAQLINEFEFLGGNMEHERFINLFQHLVDTGMAWGLQGMYGRTAMALIEEGAIHGPSNNSKEQ